MSDRALGVRIVLIVVQKEHVGKYVCPEQDLFRVYGHKVTVSVYYIE